MANNNKHTGPNVPALRFPEFSGEWEKVLLSSACEINPKTGSLDNQFLYIDLESVVKGSLVKRQIIEKDGAPSRAQRVLKENDILYQCVRPYQLNNYIFEGDTIQCVASTGYAQLRTTQFPLYIFQALHTKRFTNQVLERCTGTNYPAINSSDLGTVEVPICSLPEQVKIGSLLALIDSRIKTQSKIIEELTALRSALLEKVFQVSNPTLEVGAIAHQTSERNKLCRYSNVLSVSNRFGFINQSEQFEDRNVASDDVRNYKVVHRGDFAYNPARINVGSIAMLKSFESGIVSPMYICFQVDDTIVDPSFFELFLETKAFKDEMEIRLEGSVRRCLSFEALCEIHLPRPALLVQRSISDKIGNISSKIKLEDSILRAYIRQKEWLLKQMFI